MSRFLLSDLAKADLADIRYFVSQDKPKAARRLISSFFERFHLLAKHPEMGQAQPDLGQQVRQLVVGNYVIVYRPRRDGVEIVRVVSGFRDLPFLF